MRFVREMTDPPERLDIDALRDAVTREEVSLALVFGSYATESVSALSDLDIAVRFRTDVPRDRRLRLLDELTVAIQAATDIEAVDLIDLDEVGPRIGYEALANGIIVAGDRETAIDLEVEFLLRKLDFQPVKRAWDEALDERIRRGSFGRS